MKSGTGVPRSFRKSSVSKLLLSEVLNSSTKGKIFWKFNRDNEASANSSVKEYKGRNCRSRSVIAQNSNQVGQINALSYIDKSTNQPKRYRSGAYVQRSVLSNSDRSGDSRKNITDEGRSDTSDRNRSQNFRCSPRCVFNRDGISPVPNLPQAAHSKDGKITRSVGRDLDGVIQDSFTARKSSKSGNKSSIYEETAENCSSIYSGREEVVPESVSPLSNGVFTVTETCLKPTTVNAENELCICGHGSERSCCLAGILERKSAEACKRSFKGKQYFTQFEEVKKNEQVKLSSDSGKRTILENFIAKENMRMQEVSFESLLNSGNRAKSKPVGSCGSILDNLQDPQNVIGSEIIYRRKEARLAARTLLNGPQNKNIFPNSNEELVSKNNDILNLRRITKGTDEDIFSESVWILDGYHGSTLLSKHYRQVISRNTNTWALEIHVLHQIMQCQYALDNNVSSNQSTPHVRKGRRSIGNPNNHGVPVAFVKLLVHPNAGMIAEGLVIQLQTQTSNIQSTDRKVTCENDCTGIMSNKNAVHERLLLTHTPLDRALVTNSSSSLNDDYHSDQENSDLDNIEKRYQQSHKQEFQRYFHEEQVNFPRIFEKTAQIIREAYNYIFGDDRHSQSTLGSSNASYWRKFGLLILSEVLTRGGRSGVVVLGKLFFAPFLSGDSDDNLQLVRLVVSFEIWQTIMEVINRRFPYRMVWPPILVIHPSPVILGDQGILITHSGICVIV